MEPAQRFSFDQETDRALAPWPAAPGPEEPPPSVASQRSAALRLYDRGLHPEAEVALRSAHSGARRNMDEDLVVSTAIDLARIVFHRSPGEAAGVLRGLVGRPIPAPGPARIRLHNLLGMILFELCEPELAERQFRLALDPAAGSGDPRALGWALANRGGNLLEMGRDREARGLHRQALDRLAAENDTAGCGFVRCNMAIVDMLEGRWDDAYDGIERARTGSGAGEHDRLRALLELTEGELELLTGERDRAAGTLASAARRAGHGGLPALQARALVWRGIAEGRAGEELRRDAETAARDLHGRGLRIDGGALYLAAAVCAEREGAPDGRYRAAAAGILPEDGLARLLPGHFGRLLAAGLRAPVRGEKEPLPRFLTRSPEVRAVKRTLVRLADTEVRLLIEGESGTGKSYLARLLHEESSRRESPFVVVDCTNLEENLFESKLFGHVRGAFTGAVSDSVGLVEQAQGGTLFLDEIGEMPVEIQAKLLYTIEEERFRPVGARAEKRARLRVMAATNRDVDRMVLEGTLRSDLFYRLAGFRVRLPPLRERREDVEPLIDRRLAELNRRYGRRKSLRPGVWEAAARYDWPGNVRELNAAVERGFHLSAGRRIAFEDLTLGLSSTGRDDDFSWYAVRRTHLLRVLRLCQGNVSRAARLLGLNRTTLIYKLKLLGIERADFDPSAVDSRLAAVRAMAEPGPDG
ncbi:MAG TPA: sigma 54-interacting transcriptional regulator [Gemmatimonadota bacterium]|nr:sigma 54-interacting transcriptional regulator [Gemmatimonadota bacterium]